MIKPPSVYNTYEATEYVSELKVSPSEECLGQPVFKQSFNCYLDSDVVRETTEGARVRPYLW